MRKILNGVKILVYGAIGWLFISPLIYMISPFLQKKYIVFIGRDDGKFVDNVKYLFLHFIKNERLLRDLGYEVVFITENQEVYSLLR